MFPSIDEKEETYFTKEKIPLIITLENNIEIINNKMINHQEIENIISLTPIKIREKNIIHRKHNSKSEETKPYDKLEKIEEKTKSSTSAKKRIMETKGIKSLMKNKEDDNISSKYNDTIDEKNEEEKRTIIFDDEKEYENEKEDDKIEIEPGKEFNISFRKDYDDEENDDNNNEKYINISFRGDIEDDKKNNAFIKDSDTNIENQNMFSSLNEEQIQSLLNNLHKECNDKISEIKKDYQNKINIISNKKISLVDEKLFEGYKEPK